MRRGDGGAVGLGLSLARGGAVAHGENGVGDLVEALTVELLLGGVGDVVADRGDVAEGVEGDEAAVETGADAEGVRGWRHGSYSCEWLRPPVSPTGLQKSSAGDHKLLLFTKGMELPRQIEEKLLRAETARRELFEDDADMAKRLAIPYTSLRRALEPDPSSVARVSTLEKRLDQIGDALIDRAGVSSAWWKRGEGPMTGSGAVAVPTVGSDDEALDASGDEPETVRVPEYGEVGAGPGRIPLEVVSYREITVREFVMDFGQRPPPSGVVTGRGYFTVVGDSAAPIYFDRERVPVEELPDPTQRFRQDTVYVFRWEGDLMLKRLRKLEGGRIRAYSLNPSIDPFHFRPEGEHDFAVVAIAREPQKQQLYAVLVGRFLRFEPRPLRPEDLA